MSTYVQATEDYFRLLSYGYFQERLRNLTLGEVEEFLRGDPPALDAVPNGGEKAMALPFTNILEPASLVIGACLSESSLLKIMKLCFFL